MANSADPTWRMYSFIGSFASLDCTAMNCAGLRW